MISDQQEIKSNESQYVEQITLSNDAGVSIYHL